MTGRRRWIYIFIGFGAAVTLTILLILVYVPMTGAPSGYQGIGTQIYTFESVSLFGNVPAWQNYSYRGVTFGFHLWCLTTPGGGKICGNATDAGGAVYPYSFWDGLPQSNPPWQTWVSPDGHEAVQYREGGTAHLLVRT